MDEIKINNSTNGINARFVSVAVGVLILMSGWNMKLLIETNKIASMNDMRLNIRSNWMARIETEIAAIRVCCYE